MSILVTGGAGYIGSHVCKALRKAGFAPIVYDHFLHGHPWAVKWGPSVTGDIHDKEALSHTFQTYKPKGIIHLKTDSKELFDFTLETISGNKLKLLDSASDLYSEKEREEVKSIQTFYESGFLKKGKKICYAKFQL